MFDPTQPPPFGRPTRYVALVGALAGERRVSQTAGFPLDPAKMLPVPDVVLAVADVSAGRGAMLFRYTAHGDLAGDTWHPSWIEVPDEIGDAHAFAVRYAYEQLNSRGGW